MTSETPRSGGSPFRRNVAATSVGLAVAQGGQLALLIPISRVFDPESLGLFGAFAAVVIVAAACSTARFEMSIPTPRDAGESAVRSWPCVGRWRRRYARSPGWSRSRETRWANAVGRSNECTTTGVHWR